VLFALYPKPRCTEACCYVSLLTSNGPSSMAPNNLTREAGGNTCEGRTCLPSPTMRWLQPRQVLTSGRQHFLGTVRYLEYACPDSAPDCLDSTKHPATSTWRLRW